MTRREQSSIVILGLIVVALFAASFPATSAAQDKKLTPEELISRHVESLGSQAKRDDVRSRVVSGSVLLTMRVGGAGNLAGNAMIASAGTRLRFGMKFPVIEYPSENIAFDGARAATGLLPQGGRSRLSAFLSQQDTPLKEGLLGGVLSTAWPLLRLAEQQPRLEYRGLKKIEGQQLHEITYRPRKGSSDLKISLYFDPTTFRHVRTQYSFQIGAAVGTREASNLNPENYYSLTEEFSDFSEADGLMLPRKYRLQLSTQSGTGSAVYDYTLTVSLISHKETIDERIFSLK